MGHVIVRILYIQSPQDKADIIIAETIPTLWQTVRDFIKLHPTYVAKDNSAHFMVDDPKKGLDGNYNLCHVFYILFTVSDLCSFGQTLKLQICDFFDHNYIPITLII